MNRMTQALAALFATAILTTGCGGGGGDTASPAPSPAPAPAPAPTAATPLALNAGNAASVARLAPGLGEAVLTVAQFAVDSARRFESRGTASPSIVSCPNGGVLTITLTDRDTDGIASAGDRVTVEARDCAVPVVTDIVNGTMQIDLRTPTGLPAGGMRADIGLGSGLQFGTGTTGLSSLLGTMQFDWSSTDLQTALHVTASTADDLRVVASNGSASLTESIHAPDLSKTLKYDDARAVISLSFRYESQALTGSISVTTPDPLRAYLNTFPEAGRVEITGATGTRLTLTPNFATLSEQAQYALDTNGDGIPDSSGSINWADSVVGYLWWDGTTALNGTTTNVYPTRAFASTDFFASASFNWKTATTSTLRLQFSRPPAITTPTLYFRFRDVGSVRQDFTQVGDIPASGERHGALIVVSPTKPLRHAHYYQLEVSLDGTNWGSSATIQDTLGNSISQWPVAYANTPDNLRAIAVAQAGALLTASDQLLLGGQTSTTTVQPIVNYQWSQLSGTPLRFSDPGAAQTSVSWGAAAPSGVESAVVLLTVTDAAGDIDTTQLTLQSANVAASSHTLYFRSAAGDFIGNGRTVVIADGAGTFADGYANGYLQTLFYGNGTGVSFWSLQVASATGAPLAVGAYENAIRAPFRGAQNGIDFSYGGSGCNQTFGRFDVLEIETNSAGAITRLAVDFEQHCESATAPALLGSYRINSSVPIRR